MNATKLKLPIEPYKASGQRAHTSLETHPSGIFSLSSVAFKFAARRCVSRPRRRDIKFIEHFRYRVRVLHEDVR